MSAYLRMILEADVAAHAWDDWASAHPSEAEDGADPDDAVEAVHTSRAERDKAIDQAVGS